MDFSVVNVDLGNGDTSDSDAIAQHVIDEITNYERSNYAKFIGAGLPVTLKCMSPSLCSRLWLELDIVPIVMRIDEDTNHKSFWDIKRVEEQADSMARKCLM